MSKKLYRKLTGEADVQDSQENLKTIGLFDHIKHIQHVRDPHYYENLPESGRKSFNLFMILRGLSMHPDFVECAAYLYRYLDIIPPSNFYKILIDLYPRHRYKEFHKWIKSTKDKESVDAKKEIKVIDLLVEKFEIPNKEAKDYLRVFRSSKEGKSALGELISGFGILDKEVEEMV